MQQGCIGIQKDRRFDLLSKLDRSNEGLEQVEKSIVAYGSVQMGLLEKGLS